MPIFRDQSLKTCMPREALPVRANYAKVTRFKTVSFAVLLMETGTMKEMEITHLNNHTVKLDSSLEILNQLSCNLSSFSCTPFIRTSCMMAEE